MTPLSCMRGTGSRSQSGSSCFPTTLFSSLEEGGSLSFPPSRALLQAAVLETQGKGLGYCPAPPRFLEVVFKRFWTIPSSFFLLLSLPQIQALRKQQRPGGKEMPWKIFQHGSPHCSCPKGALQPTHDPTAT